MNRWVFLADPEAYGWTELLSDGRAVWDGIANRTAQRHLAACSKGDEVLIYHTAPDKALMGIARVVGAPRPDPDHEGRVVVDIEPVRPLGRPLPLAELKGDAQLATLVFVRMPRVAVHPVEDGHWRRVLALSGTR